MNAIRSDARREGRSDDTVFPSPKPQAGSERAFRVGGYRSIWRRALHPARSFGVTDTPRKPNYDFERREREKRKAAESAKKAQAKADRKASEQAMPDVDQPTDP